MDPVTLGLAAVNLGTGLFGMLSASSARRAAQRRAERALAAAQLAYDRMENAIRVGNERKIGLLGGVLNDRLMDMGRTLGDTMASAGVWNSGATAGALADAASKSAGSLAGYAAELDTNLANIIGQNQANLAAMRIGQANTDLGYAAQQEAGAQKNFVTGLLGSLEAFSPAAQTQQAGQRSVANLTASAVPNSRQLFTGLPGLQGYKQQTPWWMQPAGSMRKQSLFGF